MGRLRPRERPEFSGFLKSEIDKMEELLKQSGDKALDPDYCKNVAKRFTRLSDRAGKPVVKWTEVQSWFQNRLQECPSIVSSSPNFSKEVYAIPEACPSSDGHQSSEMPKESEDIDLSKLEFEARSSKDSAWYDVAIFRGHRHNSSGEAEVLVRFIGFGADEDEWVNVKNNVRLRSVPLDDTECHEVDVGDIILCFQEKRDQAIYYDAHLLGVKRRLHDIRGCRCLFTIRYDHDNSEAGNSSIEEIMPHPLIEQCGSRS